MGTFRMGDFRLWQFCPKTHNPLTRIQLHPVLVKGEKWESCNNTGYTSCSNGNAAFVGYMKVVQWIS